MKNFIFYILIIYLLYLKKSSKIDKPFLSSLSCPYVDDEKLLIRKNKQDIHYVGKMYYKNLFDKNFIEYS